MWVVQVWLDLGTVGTREATVTSVGHELTNKAVDGQHRWCELIYDDRDLQAALATCAKDAPIELHDQDRWVVTQDNFEPWFEDILNTSETDNWSIEVVAVRGDFLCLTRLSVRRSESGFGADMLNVLETNADGLITRAARFQDEQLNAAHDLLNQWWIEGLPPDLAAAASAQFGLMDLIATGDRIALLQRFDDDFVMIDHRSMRTNQLDRHEVVDMWLTRHEITPGFTMLFATVKRLTMQGNVSIINTVTPDGFVTESVSFQITRDAMITHGEAFDTHDLDRALARFDELTSSSPN